MIEEKKQNVKEKDNEKMRKHKYGIHYFDKKAEYLVINLL